jgi:hypothetical protein
MALEKPVESHIDHHIENPFEYVAEKLSWAVSDGTRAFRFDPARHADQAVPAVRKITAADLWDALKKGMAVVGDPRRHRLHRPDLSGGRPAAGAARLQL